MTLRSLAIVLILLLGFVQYKLWFAADGVAQTIRLNHSLSLSTMINQQFQKIDQQLEDQVKILKLNTHSVAGLARQQLGMIKPGEKYYQFVK